MAIDFTYEKSNLGTFLDELPELLLQYKQMQLQADQARMEKEQRDKERQEDLLFRDKQFKEDSLRYDQELEFKEKQLNIDKAISQRDYMQKVTEYEETRDWQKKVYDEELIKAEKLGEIQTSLELIKMAQQNKYTKGNIFLQNVVESNVTLRNQILQTGDEISKLGIVNDKISKLKDEEKTLSGKLTGEDGEKYLADLNSNLLQQLEANNTIIADHKKGFDFANKYDANTDGILSQEELIQSGIEINKDNKAFMRGVDSYGSDALQRLNLQGMAKDILLAEENIVSAQIKNEADEIMLEYLPDQYRMEYEKGDIELRLLGMKETDVIKNRELQDETLKEAKYKNSLLKMEVDKVKRELENLPREEAIKKIATLQNFEAENIALQPDIATAILTKMMIGSDKNSAGMYESYTPFISLILDQSKTLDDVKTATEDLPSIQPDLMNAFLAFQLGTSTDTVADFKPILRTLVEAQDDYQAYKDFYSVHGRKTINLGDMDQKPMSVALTPDELLDKLNSDAYTERQRDSIKRGIEWNSTGIFKDPEYLKQAQRVLDQGDIIKQTIENINLKELIQEDTLFDMPSVFFPASDSSAIDSINTIFRKNQ
mgnify:CR=1 FL=1